MSPEQVCAVVLLGMSFLCATLFAAFNYSGSASPKDNALLVAMINVFAFGAIFVSLVYV